MRQPNEITDTNTSGADVLACPFCGHHAHYDSNSDWVSCSGCGATGPTGDDQVSAIDAWNSRTAVAALIERNAELEAERDAAKFRPTNRNAFPDDPRPLGERLQGYALQFGNDTFFARTVAALLLEAHSELVKRDALAAEVKALRQKVEAARELAYSWRDFERSYDRSIQDATDCSDDLLALIDAARASAATGDDGGVTESDLIGGDS